MAFLRPGRGESDGVGSNGLGPAARLWYAVVVESRPWAGLAATGPAACDRLVRKALFGNWVYIQREKKVVKGGITQCAACA